MMSKSPYSANSMAKVSRSEGMASLMGKRESMVGIGRLWKSAEKSSKERSDDGGSGGGAAGPDMD